MNSVLSQNFADFEVVIVDDGSTDGGNELVKRKFSDPRIRLIQQEHQGVSVARNRGVAEAGNELIALLDADDIWLQKYLETIGEAINTFPESAMYCCAGFTLYPDGSGFSRTSRRYRGKSRQVNFFAAPGFFANCSSIVVRKPKFLECGGFPPGMAQMEDTVFFYKLALRGSVVFCPIPLTVYRKGIVDQCSEAQFDRSKALLEMCNRIYAYWSSLDPRERDVSCIESVTLNMRYILFWFIRDRSYSRIDDLFNSLDPGLVRYFTAVERSAATNLLARLATVLYFNFFRLKHRLLRPRQRYLKNVRGVVYGSAAL